MIGVGDRNLTSIHNQNIINQNPQQWKYITFRIRAVRSGKCRIN